MRTTGKSRRGAREGESGRDSWVDPDGPAGEGQGEGSPAGRNTRSPVSWTASERRGASPRWVAVLGREAAAGSPALGAAAAVAAAAAAVDAGAVGRSRVAVLTEIRKVPS